MLRLHFLLCCILSACISVECGKHQKNKKKPKDPRITERRIECTPNMTIADLAKIVADQMGTDPDQLHIIVNKEDLLSRDNASLQELGITGKSKPQVVVRTGKRRPKPRALTVKKE